MFIGCPPSLLIIIAVLVLGWVHLGWFLYVLYIILCLPKSDNLIIGPFFILCARFGGILGVIVLGLELCKYLTFCYAKTHHFSKIQTSPSSLEWLLPTVGWLCFNASFGGSFSSDWLSRLSKWNSPISAAIFSWKICLRLASVLPSSILRRISSDS